MEEQENNAEKDGEKFIQLNFHYEKENNLFKLMKIMKILFHSKNENNNNNNLVFFSNF